MVLPIGGYSVILLTCRIFMSVKNAILGLLFDKPRHAYEVYAALQDMIGEKQGWDVKPAQVYTTLERLQASGMVSSRPISDPAGSQKTIYSITPSGQQALMDWLSAPAPTFYPRNEFFTKLALKLLIQPDEAYELITLQRSSLRQEMQSIAALRNRIDPQANLVYTLLLDHSLSHLEIDLHWLDKLEVSRRQVLNQPVAGFTSRRRGRPAKQSEE